MAKMFSIPQAATEAKCTEAWIRSAIRTKTLPTTQQPTHAGSEVMKHMISEEDLHAWMRREGRKIHRGDSRSKWIMYGTPEEIQLVKDCLFMHGDEVVKIVAATIRPNSVKENYLQNVEKQT